MENILEYPTREGVVVRVQIDKSRDNLLTNFGLQTLKDRYLMPGEQPQELFARVACWFANDAAHAQRLYDYISKLWFMPATPVLSNGGTDRGNPISCFLNYVDDSLEGIIGTWSENAWLAARGGGIGTYWGAVRSIDEPIANGLGKTSGVVPFIKVMDSETLAISQGSLRRGSAAVYMDISHPEIEEFIDIRKPTGDPNRRSLNIHHGVNVTDEFMMAVERGEEFNLVSPRDGSVRKTVSARNLWQKILEQRISTGEPYILFIDTVNRSMPEHQKALGLQVRQSNLCSEITLPTGPDMFGNERTAVCCLSSLNIAKYFEWKNNRQFLKDCLLFLDNVLQDFIDKTEGVKGFEKARYSASRERSIGLGVMGYHTFLQQNNIPFESLMASVWNKNIFKWLRETADEINQEVARERGANPDSQMATEYAGEHKQDIPLVRWSNMFAVAPTASISIICGGVSAGIEPIPANSYTQKTLSGSFAVRNPQLEKLLKEKAYNVLMITNRDQQAEEDVQEWLKQQWSSITQREGSVEHLSYLSEEEKEVFRTAFEIDQRWLIQHMSDRAPYVDQAVSNNLFMMADVHVGELHGIHFHAWKKGIKSLYYLRSKSVQRAESEWSATNVAGEMPQPEQFRSQSKDYEECLVCQ